MQGRKGASLESTRKIHRREVKKWFQTLALLERDVHRPGYVWKANCLRLELARMQWATVTGQSVPVGVLIGTWKQVCDEFLVKLEG